MKASLLNTQIWTEKSDVYIDNIQNTWNLVLHIKSSKEILWAKSLSLSFVYNKENIVIKEKKVYLEWTELLNIIQNDGYNTVMINFKNPTDIKAWNTLLDIILEKKDNQKETVNIINANLTDEHNNIFMLSTSGVEF